MIYLMQTESAGLTWSWRTEAESWEAAERLCGEGESVVGLWIATVDGGPL